MFSLLTVLSDDAVFGDCCLDDAFFVRSEFVGGDSKVDDGEWAACDLAREPSFGQGDVSLC